MADETLLLIGSGPGLGDAVARRFGREGWRVVLAARDRERLEAQAQALRDDGVDAGARPVDAADPAAVRALVTGVLESHGRIDALNYNAAALRQGALLDIAPEALATDLQVNVGGAMIAAQAALPSMIARKRGTVLLTGGGLAVDPWPAYTSLAVGKGALRAFAQCMARDPALADIHVAHVIVHARINPEVAARIADVYWDLHSEPRDQWRHETEFRA